MRLAEFQIRRAAAADCTAIAEVLYQSFREYKALYTGGGFAATTPDAEQIRARMPEGPVWVALRDGVMVGTVSAVLKGESVYIRSMAVLPAARGSGTGSGLLREVENWAAGQRCKRLFLSTTPFLNSAIRLYERAGFRRMEEGPQELFGTPLFTMEKNLLAEMLKPSAG
jgi:putative acetyltransferase